MIWRKLFFVSGLVLLLWPLLTKAQAGTGCCYNSGDFCLEGLDQRACDSSYFPSTAGANFHVRQACSTVSQCTPTGKCVKTDGSDCQNLQKWQCDAKPSVYKFFQGQSCGAAAPVGTCCVQGTSVGSPTKFCEDNVDKTSCDAKQGGWYNTACSGVAACAQASIGAPAIIQPTATISPTIIFNPEVPFPGFLGGPIKATSIADYIRVVFVFFIWTVGLLAVFMVIFGGIKWITAAGNPGQINEARATINNSIIGLIIALTSVLLLNTINPDLRSFHGLALTDVKKEIFQQDNAPGEHNEAATCLSLSRPVQSEATCVVSRERFAWPVDDAPLKINSPVGPRNCAGCSKCHPGTDFSTDKKTNKPLLAVVEGTISTSGPICGEQTIKLVSQDGKFYIKYLHVGKAIFGNGDHVKKGAPIGYSGGSSPPATCSNGPHAHIELYDQRGQLHDIAPCVLQ